MKKSLKTIALTTAVFALAACGSNGKWQAQLNEAQVAAKLAAENTKNYQDTYSDIYFHLGSLTPADFERRVAAGETLYVYIGRRAAATAPLSNHCSNAISPNTNWTARFGSSMSTACAGRRTSGRRSSSVTTFQARPCWPNTPKAGSRINWTLKTTAASARKIWKNG